MNTTYDTNDYNAAPLGLKEVSAETFAQADFWTYTAKKEEHRYITRYPEGVTPIKGLSDIRMYWMHDGHGWGMAQDYWGKKVRYFSFGCEHEWNEEKIGNCLHLLTCKLCGTKREVDSSG